jgi:hypothetical protein
MSAAALSCLDLDDDMADTLPAAQRRVIFAITGLTMTASASQLLQNSPHVTLDSTNRY